MSIRLLYNASSARVGGGLSYATQQITALARMPNLELCVLTSPWNHTTIATATLPYPVVKTHRLPLLNAGHRFLWEQVQLRNMARGYDALLCPGNFAPLRRPLNTPMVTILQNPNYVGRGRRARQNERAGRRLKILLSHLGMRASDLVVLISHSLAAEFNTEPSLARCQTTVVRSGAPELPQTDGRRLEDVLPAANTNNGFFLSVANYYPHKHLDTIAASWAQSTQGKEDAPSLVFVGDIPEDERQKILHRTTGVSPGQVLFLGTVADRSTIALLYQYALGAVAMSSLEAFPLTLHEAGSMGCPLILSDIPPHRELAEHHATFVPPDDEDALSSAFKDVAISRKRAVWNWDYSWDDHAKDLLDQLCSVIGRRR